MRINIESVHFDLSQGLENQVTEKITKLTTYYENIVDAVVYMREGVDLKEVEIKLIVPDTTLFVQEKDATFNNALDSAYEAMKRQLIKYKEKHLKKV